MYWYNPTTRISERRTAPTTDDEAVEMLAGNPQSATFVSEYTRLRSSGMEIEQALILVGHQFRLRQMEHTSPNAFRPRAIGYRLLVGTEPSNEEVSLRTLVPYPPWCAGGLRPATGRRTADGRPGLPAGAHVEETTRGTGQRRLS